VDDRGEAVLREGGHVAGEGTTVRLDGVSKRYSHALRPAVDRLSVSIEAGTAVGLLGANGAGKTTTVRMLTGLLPPDTGVVQVLGRDPRETAVRAGIGYLPEKPSFPPGLTARQVLVYVAQLHGLLAPVRRDRVDGLLEWAGLAGDGRPVRHFSKGMRQRLGLAQALIAEPSLLILDEPTADLDPAGRAQVRDLVVAVAARGGTVIVNSHLLGDVEKVCQRVLVLRTGQLVADLRVSELQEHGRDLETVFMELSGTAAAALPAFMAQPPPALAP
jgi:ABC-2 type transport system ATP-binding protein